MVLFPVNGLHPAGLAPEGLQGDALSYLVRLSDMKGPVLPFKFMTPDTKAR